jgi:excisionase family DNA binding protein
MTGRQDATAAVHVPAAVDVKQAAYLLKMNPESVRDALRAGRLTGARIGRSYIIAGASVAAWLETAGVPTIITPVTVQETS